MDKRRLQDAAKRPREARRETAAAKPAQRARAGSVELGRAESTGRMCCSRAGVGAMPASGRRAGSGPWRMESKTAAASASAVAARVESLGGAGVVRRLGLDDISSWFVRVRVDGGRAGKRCHMNVSSASFSSPPSNTDPACVFLPRWVASSSRQRHPPCSLPRPPSFTLTFNTTNRPIIRGQGGTLTVPPPRHTTNRSRSYRRRHPHRLAAPPHHQLQQVIPPHPTSSMPATRNPPSPPNSNLDCRAPLSPSALICHPVVR
jgi:hypothetical protein